MTQFSSKPPFNDDPTPWVGFHGKRYEHDWQADGIYHYGARPEYNRPQHNPTNPLLLAYRDGDVNADQVIHMSGVLVGAWVGPTVITETHAEHARKVLERIKAVFG